MALTQQQQNFVGRLIERSRALLDQRDDIKRDLELYNGLNFSDALTDEALAATPGIEHLTQGNVWNAISAQQEFADTLDAESSKAALALIKLMR